MDTFRHKLFVRLGLFLLVAVLFADLFAGRYGDSRVANDGTPAAKGISVAVLEPGLPANAFAATASELLSVQDFLETAHAVAPLHRAPRLSRPLPDAGCGATPECTRPAVPCTEVAVGRPLRAHHALYCVYRI